MALPSFVMYTDASALGLGTVVKHHDARAKQCTAAFAINTMNEAESNLAVLWALKWRN